MENDEDEWMEFEESKPKKTIKKENPKQKQPYKKNQNTYEKKDNSKWNVNESKQEQGKPEAPKKVVEEVKKEESDSNEKPVPSHQEEKKPKKKSQKKEKPVTNAEKPAPEPKAKKIQPKNKKQKQAFQYVVKEVESEEQKPLLQENKINSEIFTVPVANNAMIEPPLEYEKIKDKIEKTAPVVESPTKSPQKESIPVTNEKPKNKSPLKKEAHDGNDSTMEKSKKKKNKPAITKSSTVEYQDDKASVSVNGTENKEKSISGFAVNESIPEQSFSGYGEYTLGMVNLPNGSKFSILLPTVSVLSKVRNFVNKQLPQLKMINCSFINFSFF